MVIGKQYGWTSHDVGTLSGTHADKWMRSNRIKRYDLGGAVGFPSTTPGWRNYLLQPGSRGPQNVAPIEPTKTWSLDPGLNQKPPIVTGPQVICANGPRCSSRSPP